MNTQQLKELALDITEYLFDTGSADDEATSAALKLAERKLRPVFNRLEAAERANAAQDDHINQQQTRIDWLEAANSGLGKALGAAKKELARLKAAAGDHSVNPVFGYADSYRCMASQGVKSIPIWSVITDLERNLAPLYTAAPPAASVTYRNQLRELVDLVWNEATESTTVPCTADADRIIDKVFHGIAQEPASSRYQSTAASVPDGWKLVPTEPTEDMVIRGFESKPDEFWSKPEEWKAYEEMSGCQQAAHKARLCYAAMLEAAPAPGGDHDA